jgi:hypothetical protein
MLSYNQTNEVSMIGATSGKEPDAIADEDLRTPDQLRGDMQAINEARLSLREKGTVAGVQAEISVLKQQLEMTHEQMRRLIGMYGTLRAEFDVFQQQRIKELNVRINGGSTTPEDQ